MTLTAGRAVQASMAMIVPIMLVRFLDQVDYGNYRKIVLFLTAVPGVLILALPNSVYYYVSRTRSSCHRLVVRTVVVLFGLGLLSGAIVFFSADRLGQIFDVPLTLYLPWVIAYVVLSMPASLTYLLPQLDQRAQLQAVLLVVIDALRTALLVIAVVVTGSLDGLLAALCVYVVVKLLALFLYLPARRREDPEIDKSPGFGDQLRYAMPLWGGSLMQLARAHGHAFFVAAMFDSREFAVYAVATMAIPVLPFINETIGDVMFIQTARWFGEGNLVQMRRVWFRALHNLALALIPVFFVLEVFAYDLVVTMFGTDYVGSVAIFRIYLFLLLSWVPLLCSPQLKATGDGRTHFFGDLASFLGTITVLLLGARFGGLYFAAFSTAAGYFVFAIVASPIVGKRMGLGPLQIYPFGAFVRIASCAAFGCLLPWTLMVSFSPAVRLFVGGPLAGMLFAAAAWRFNAIEAAEKDLVCASLHRVLPPRYAKAVIRLLAGS